ncbi:MAG: hypothetical protein DMG31_14910 [Acidobacteria bacterium]|nr:MAG: hypothetical protein DMG31_14910 [Acidobacteriota bacterium]
MRIEFLTQNDPLYMCPFFDEFLQHYGSEFEVIQISCCRAMGSRPRLKLLRELLSLYGPVGVLYLSARVVSGRVLGMVPAKRGTSRFYSIAQLCRAYGIPFGIIGSPNSTEVVNALNGRAPDLIASVACPYVLKEPVRKIPPLGCINIHQATLQKYRGMMHTFWQMYHGESKVGLTIHYMGAKVDEGAVLLQEALDIEPDESLHHLIQRSKRHGAHAMAQVLRKIASGIELKPRVVSTQGSYFTFPTIEQIREFRRRGFRAV